MNPETIKQFIQAIIDGLTPLAVKLQIPIENLWHWAMKNNYAQAVSDIGYFITWLVVTKFYWKFVKWGMGKDEGYNESRFYYKDHLVVTSVLIGIGLAIGGIIAIVAVFSDAIPRLIAPEYQTASDIVRLIQGK